MEYIERVLLRHTALAAAIEDARAPSLPRAARATMHAPAQSPAAARFSPASLSASACA